MIVGLKSLGGVCGGRGIWRVSSLEFLFVERSFLFGNLGFSLPRVRVLDSVEAVWCVLCDVSLRSREYALIVLSSLI